MLSKLRQAIQTHLKLMLTRVNLWLSLGNKDTGDRIQDTGDRIQNTEYRIQNSEFRRGGILLLSARVA